MKTLTMKISEALEKTSRPQLNAKALPFQPKPGPRLSAK